MSLAGTTGSSTASALREVTDLILVFWEQDVKFNFSTSLQCSPEIFRKISNISYLFISNISNYAVFACFAHFCLLSPYRCLVGSSSENVRGHAAGQAAVINSYLHSFHTSKIFEIANEIYEMV